MTLQRPRFFEAPNKAIYLVCQHGGHLPLDDELAEIIWLGFAESQTELPKDLPIDEPPESR